MGESDVTLEAEEGRYWSLNSHRNERDSEVVLG